MVAAQRDPGTADCCVVIRPNCSLSWRGSLTVFGGISLVSCSIALGFLAQGYWLILPFAGLELILLGAAFYLTAWRTALREVIRIEGAVVEVQKGHRQPESVQVLPRGWVSVELACPPRRGYPTRLVLRAHGRSVQIGDCLNEHERDQLAKDLRRWVMAGSVPLPAA